MEGQFPKNVRQVGNVSDTPKIYVEDYVDTYLSQLREQVGEQPVGAFLIGHMETIEEQECVCVTGALQMREPDSQSSEEDIEIDDKILDAARQDAKEYFDDKELIGWFMVMPGRPLALTGNMTKIHEKMFPKSNSLFVLMDAEMGEELYFAYKYQELMQMGGHYIFYEKNPQMQNYMIQMRRQIGVTPSEMVEDRAAKDFRSTVREKMITKEQKTSSRFVYAMSVFLVLVVLVIGISAMNNYDKMTAVQTSIEALSKSVQSTSVPVSESDSAGTKENEVAEEEMPAKNTEEQERTPNQAGKENVASAEAWNEEDYYTVQKGDTLDKISRKIYGTTEETDAICKMNGLTDGNLIYIGQKLLLP